MIKTASLAAFLAASAFALVPGAASARVIEIGSDGVSVHGADLHHAPAVAYQLAEETHGSGHAEEHHEPSHETSHETSHGDKEHH